MRQNSLELLGRFHIRSLGVLGVLKQGSVLVVGPYELAHALKNECTIRNDNLKTKEFGSYLFKFRVPPFAETVNKRVAKLIRTKLKWRLIHGDFSDHNTGFKILKSSTDVDSNGYIVLLDLERSFISHPFLDFHLPKWR